MTGTGEAADVVVAVDGDEAFLLHVPTGRYFGLNRTGLVVWRALEAGRDPVEALRASHPGVPVHTLRADVEALLARLQEAGIWQPSPTT